MTEQLDEFFFDPAEGHGLPHDPFKAIVAPRAIGWISSKGKAGNVNLAPYSFFGAFSTFPYVIGFASDGKKDSIRNVEETGEFVWNFTSRALAEKMNITSAPVGSNVDEFELAGLTKAPSKKVSVPYVAESPAALECRLINLVQLNTFDGKPFDNWLALGQVVGVHIRREFLKDGLFDTVAAEPIMRIGYRSKYVNVGDPFDMQRPTSTAV